MADRLDNMVLQAVTQSLSKTFKQAVTINSNTSLGGGCISHASKLKTSVGTFFLKWNNHCSRDLFTREAESLNELSKSNNPFLLIPEVIAFKELDDTPAFLLLEYLQPASSSGKNTDELLGRGLALIHSIKHSKFGFYNDNYCGDTLQNNKFNNNWIDFYGQQRLFYIIQLIKQKSSLPTHHFETYNKLIEKLPQLIPPTDSAVLIHGDLWAGNYMVSANGPALIDPCAYYANREMEMGIMTLFGGFSPRFWDAYNEINPLPYEWKSRNKLYQLYHILNHHYLFGGGYGQQAIQIAKYYITT